MFHLGACSATTEKNATYLADNNYGYTKELAAWSLAQGARFIYASSAATYGDGAQGIFSEHQAGLHIKDAGAIGFAVFNAKGMGRQRPDWPDGVKVAEDQRWLGCWIGVGRGKTGA